jgi:DNA-binding NtrC family response regulator
MANILVVDDDVLVVQSISRALTGDGHTVVTASNGIQGLARFSKGRFDLVITDIIMPDHEGLGMILEMRRSAPTTKIIAMSGGGRSGNLEFLRMASELGAMATLKKPIRLDEFKRVLNECLSEGRGTKTMLLHD